MNFRTTLVLLALVVIGAVVVFIVNSREGDTDSKTASSSREPVAPGQGKKLFDISADDVTRLVLTPADGRQPVQLVKSDGKWRAEGPEKFALDEWTTRSFVDSVVGLRSRGKVELAGDNRTATGLDKPRYTIDATAKDGKTIKLAVGNRSALGSDLYVVADSGSSADVVLGGSLAEKLEDGTDKLLESLRDKQLLADMSSSDVKQATITRRGGKTLAFSKQGEQWKVTEPKEVPAEDSEVSSLLSVVTNMQADSFVKPGSPEASVANFEQPRATVWLAKDAPSTQPTTTKPSSRPAGLTVVIGQYADVEKTKTYVKVGDVVAIASLGESQWDRLVDASPVTLRDKDVLDIKPDAVSKVSILTEKAAATQPTTQPASKRLVVLERRSEVQVAPAPAPAAGPAAPTPQSRVPTPDGEGAVMLAAFQEQAAEAPQVKPAAAPAPQPTTNATTGPTTKPTTTPSTQPATAPAAPPPQSKWLITSDPKSDADDMKVATLLNALSPLRVDKYLEPPSSSTQPATQPAAVATYVVRVHTRSWGDEPAREHELKITDPGGGAEAKLRGQIGDLTFELPRTALEPFTADFAPPKIEPAGPTFLPPTPPAPAPIN